MNNPARTDLHSKQQILTYGTPLAEARAAMLMIHGRGASARDILSLAADLDHPEFAYLAPQAANNTWYPYGFMSPLEQNEPWLSSALHRVGEVLQQISEHVELERVILLGFSQGACLTSEYAARNARRYGGVVALSGGVIGPDGTPRNYPSSLSGTPAFFGCSDVDFHIPKERVQLSANVFRTLGAIVEERLYPNMEHTINQDEIDYIKGMMDRIRR